MERSHKALLSPVHSLIPLSMLLLSGAAMSLELLLLLLRFVLTQTNVRRRVTMHGAHVDTAFPLSLR